MSIVRVTRRASIPDRVRISRYARAPELGPRILFFSGGSALTEASRVLKKFTHNSVHLVTPFDSGGSSAKLRQAFQMPSIGDLRSRMMALADETVTGHPEVYQLFTYRFPTDAKQRSLASQLDDMVEGRDPMVAPISNPMRQLIRNQLGFFRDAMPEDFDLRGASIGNLILAGGYLNNHQQLDPIIFLFSKLVEVRGTVRAMVDNDLYLGAELEDGSCVIGQHRMTGKEFAPLSLAVKRLFLTRRLDKCVETETTVRKKNRKLISKSDLLCYPPGSFYSSLLANLLPHGVGKAIAGPDCPKVYIPSLGPDPEQIGMTFDRMVTTLIKQLRVDAGNGCTEDRLLNFILLDSKTGIYPSRISRELVHALGVQIIDTRLISERSAPYYDAELLVSAILSLT